MYVFPLRHLGISGIFKMWEEENVTIGLFYVMYELIDNILYAGIRFSRNVCNTVTKASTLNCENSILKEDKKNSFY